MATEIKIEDKEGTNFVLWIIFLLLLGSGAILISSKERLVGFVLFVSAFVFWISVRFYSKRKKQED